MSDAAPDMEQNNGAEQHHQQQQQQQQQRTKMAFAQRVAVLVPQTQREQIDEDYVKSLPGVLKIVTTLVLFCTFCCGISTGAYMGEVRINVLASNPAIIAQVPKFIGAAALWTACGCGTGLAIVPFILLEFVYYVAGFFWFFIQLWLLLAACIRESSAAAIIGFLLTIGLLALYGFEAFLKLSAWRRRHQQMNQRQGATTVQHLP